MKKIMVLFLVCFLVCSSVWAVEGFSALTKKTESSSSVPEKVEPVKDSETVTTDIPTEKSQSTSEAKALTTSTALSAVSASLSTNSTLSKKQLSELTTQLAIVQSDIDLLITDNKAKEKEILRLSGTRPFVMGGLTLGFENSAPKLGIVLDGGIRSTDGFMVAGNVGYGLVTFKPGKADFNYNLDRWSFGVKAGYMW